MELTRQGTTYVLDTCVLLADPRALFRFEEHHVVLPLVVVEELDRNKARMDEVGRNARTAVRLLEELRVRSGSGLREPVDLPSGGTLAVEGNHADTVEVDEHSTGVTELDVDAEVLDLLHRDGKAALAGAERYLNECLVLRAGRSSSGLARVVGLDRAVDGSTV